MSPLVMPLACGVIVGALVAGLVQQNRIVRLNDRIAVLQINDTLLSSSNAVCAADMQAVREGWEEYRRQIAAERVAAQAEQAVERADAAARLRRAQALAARPATQDAPAECSAVADLLHDYRQGRSELQGAK